MQCCCCCSSSKEELEPEPRPDPDPQPPRCVKYRVTIESIDVTDIDDGFLGGTLETDWTFVVNGQVQRWEDEDLDTGTHNIGRAFFVDVPANTSTITISVSGVERDTFADDQLPGFTHIWGEADNWGLGSQSRSASNSTITYTLNYSISCVESSSTFSVSKSALLKYGRQKAERRGVDVDEATAVSWAMTRLERSDWEVIQATEDQLIFRGHGTLPKQIEQELGG